MKRLSYMHDYATPDGTVIHVHPVVHSPRLFQSVKHTNSISRTSTNPTISSFSSKQPNLSSQNTMTKFGRELHQENVRPPIKPIVKGNPVSSTKPSRRYLYGDYTHTHSHTLFDDPLPRDDSAGKWSSQLKTTVSVLW